MRHYDAGDAVKVEDIACDLMRRLCIERSRRFIGKQNGGLLQQAPGYGNALLFAAGQPLSVFAAEIAVAPLSDQCVKVGMADGVLYLLLGEAAEHGNIVPDGRIKDENILLNDRNKLIQGFGSDASQLRIVDKDIPSVVPGSCRQQIEHCGFSAAACANHRIRLPGIEECGNSVQDLLAVVIAERNVFKPYAACKMGKLRSSLGYGIAFKRGRQLIYKATGSFAACKQSRKLCDGRYHEVHKVYKDYNNAGGKSIA